MLHALLNLFFPPVCAGCDNLLLQTEFVICSQCRHEIPLTYHHLQPQNEASTKFFGRIPVESVTTFAYFHKQGIVQKMIHKLKYRGQQDVGKALGYWFAENLKSVCAHADAIIPVPLHPKKLRKRGYNQVDTFGQALSETLQIPVDATLLRRNFYSSTQTKKNLFARSEIRKDLFEADYTQAHHDKHFLLIDDVLTTGSTLEACSRALLKIPGARISIACLAFTHS